MAQKTDDSIDFQNIQTKSVSREAYLGSQTHFIAFGVPLVFRFTLHAFGFTAGFCLIFSSQLGILHIMCKKIFLLILPLLVSGLLGSVSAANYYVRPDGGSYGSEDGSDWNNAFDGFDDVQWGSSPGQVGAGDILYVAGGNYTSTLEPQTSGTSDFVRVIIRRATVAEHGTDAGWSSSFDTQINLLTTAYIRIYQQSYITIDGVTEYGFYVESPDESITNAYGIYVRDADNITVQYIKTNGANNGNDFRGMYWLNASNIKVRHCWFSDCPNDAILIGGDNSLIEYCILGPRITSSGGYHADAMEVRATENITFRYNEQNWTGDGIQFGIMSGVTDHWDIHGNIFRGTYSSGVAIKTNSDDPDVTNIYVYNNVFYDLYNAVTGRSNTSGVAENNIFYNVQKVLYSFGGYTHDYNYFKDGTGDEEPPAETHRVVGGDPFVNSGGLNFHLDDNSTAINAGTNVGTTYQTDPDGNTRGQDGGWDIGAYEYITAPIGDFTGECVVDFEDVNVFANKWLVNDYNLAGSLSTGLVSHYKFDGDANDSFGGNNGTELGGPTYTAGFHHQAIDLDGTDDYVNCGNDSSFNITDSITLSAVIKGMFNNSWDGIITRGYDWQLTKGMGNEAAFYCLGPGFIFGSTNINNNQWHHVAGVYDGSMLYLYVDGKLDASKSTSGSLNISGSSVYIGGSPSQSFNGLIDDVLIYSRALAKDEIEYLAGGGTDLNTDGIVNFKDFAILADNWLAGVE